MEFDVKALTDADFHGLKYLFQQLFWTVCMVIGTFLSEPEPLDIIVVPLGATHSFQLFAVLIVNYLLY